MYKGTVEDFKIRKMISSALVRTHFAEPWQFRIEIDGMTADLARKDGSGHSVFDYLAKNVSFGPDEFTTEPVEAGAAVFTYPKSVQPVAISLTVRDTADRILYGWFDNWFGKVHNKDGTFNLPSTYVKKLTIWTYGSDSGPEKDLWHGQVYPQKMGDIEMSVDGEGFTEFPILFQQFASLGKHT